MAVFRVEKTKNYTVMSNHHLKDKGLSLKGKGLLSVMLSLPDQWDFSIRGLAAISKEGVDGIGATLKELEKAGYLIRNKLRDSKGRIADTEYVIYEYPQTPPPDNPKMPPPDTPPPCTDSPHTEKPYMDRPSAVAPQAGLPQTEKTTQLNTNQTNLKELNPNVLNIHQSIAPSYPQASQQPNGSNEKQDRIDSMDSRSVYLEIIKENIDYDSLCEQHKYHVQEIDEIVALMLEVVCSNRKTIRISGEDKPTALVKSCMLKLDFSHVEYILETLAKNTTHIRNIKSYLLTTIYNAPNTINSYYRAAVNHDFYGDK